MSGKRLLCLIWKHDWDYPRYYRRECDRCGKHQTGHLGEFYPDMVWEDVEK